MTRIINQSQIRSDPASTRTEFPDERPNDMKQPKERAMANQPRPAREKRNITKKKNAQGEHEGSAHDPSEFDPMNPARIKDKPDGDVQEQQ